MIIINYIRKKLIEVENDLQFTSHLSIINKKSNNNTCEQLVLALKAVIVIMKLDGKSLPLSRHCLVMTVFPVPVLP
jgi:hypothetical protein